MGSEECSMAIYLMKEIPIHIEKLTFPFKGNKILESFSTLSKTHLPVRKDQGCWSSSRGSWPGASRRYRKSWDGNGLVAMEIRR